MELESKYNVRCTILIMDAEEFMYIKADQDVIGVYIDLFERYFLDEDEINFPKEFGIYEVIVDFVITEESSFTITTINSSVKLLDLA